VSRPIINRPQTTSRRPSAPERANAFRWRDRRIYSGSDTSVSAAARTRVRNRRSDPDRHAAFNPLLTAWRPSTGRAAPLSKLRTAPTARQVSRPKSRATRSSPVARPPEAPAKARAVATIGAETGTVGVGHETARLVRSGRDTNVTASGVIHQRLRWFREVTFSEVDCLASENAQKRASKRRGSASENGEPVQLRRRGPASTRACSSRTWRLWQRLRWPSSRAARTRRR
jgi:hypothetical protein